MNHFLLKCSCSVSYEPGTIFSYLHSNICIPIHEANICLVLLALVSQSDFGKWHYRLNNIVKVVFFLKKVYEVSLLCHCHLSFLSLGLKGSGSKGDTEVVGAKVEKKVGGSDTCKGVLHLVWGGT